MNQWIKELRKARKILLDSILPEGYKDVYRFVSTIVIAGPVSMPDLCFAGDMLGFSEWSIQETVADYIDIECITLTSDRKLTWNPEKANHNVSSKTYAEEDTPLLSITCVSMTGSSPETPTTQ